MAYVGASQHPVLGFANGSVVVLARNTTTGQYYPSQTLASGFTSVAASDAGESRYVICDSATGKVRVYYWNYTTSTLNGDLAADSLTTTTIAGAGCTALDLVPDERFIVLGYSNGEVYLLKRDGINNTYTIDTSDGPAAPVVDLRVLDDDYAVVCRSTGSATLMSVDAGTISNGVPPGNCQSIDVRPQSNEVAIGTKTDNGGNIYR